MSDSNINVFESEASDFENEINTKKNFVKRSKNILHTKIEKRVKINLKINQNINKKRKQYIAIANKYISLNNNNFKKYIVN